MADRADAFIALPGSFGTLDELFEFLTWAQFGIHRKPVGLLNVGGFFDHLLGWMDHCVAEGSCDPSTANYSSSYKGAVKLSHTLTPPLCAGGKR